MENYKVTKDGHFTEIIKMPVYNVPRGKTSSESQMSTPQFVIHKGTENIWKIWDNHRDHEVLINRKIRWMGDKQVAQQWADKFNANPKVAYTDSHVSENVNKSIDITKWWNYTPEQILAKVYKDKMGSVPQSPEEVTKLWMELSPKLQEKWPAPGTIREGNDSSARFFVEKGMPGFWLIKDRRKNNSTVRSLESKSFAQQLTDKYNKDPYSAYPPISGVPGSNKKWVDESVETQPADSSFEQSMNTSVDLDQKKPTSVTPEAASTIDNFNQLGMQLRRANTLSELGEKLSQCAEVAESLLLRQQDDWFDAATVKRNMKEIKKTAEEFAKHAKEADALHQRITALYDDLGHNLQRYFHIKDL